MQTKSPDMTWGIYWWRNSRRAASRHSGTFWGSRTDYKLSIMFIAVTVPRARLFDSRLRDYASTCLPVNPGSPVTNLDLGLSFTWNCKLASTPSSSLQSDALPVLRCCSMWPDSDYQGPGLGHTSQAAFFVFLNAQSLNCMFPFPSSMFHLCTASRAIWRFSVLLKDTLSARMQHRTKQPSCQPFVFLSAFSVLQKVIIYLMI